jgi:DNA-binding transcriptional MerR regulator
MKKNHFTTGEFAKICRVNKQTLFYYDKEEIFQPDIVDEKGYRYYSFTQFETFFVISMLRDLGVPIIEIKSHMKNRSPETLITLMRAKSMEIDRRIETLKLSKKYIENKISVTAEGREATRDKIVRVKLPARHMVTSDYKGAKDDNMSLTESLGEHINYCDALGLYNACPIGALIPVNQVSDSSYSYSKFYTVVDNAREDFFAPAGEYIAIYDEHGYSNIHKNCLKIMDYAAQNNINIGDYFYEDLILDDLSTEGYFNYLVRLAVKISD